MKTKIICFEGITGAGKTEQTKRTAEYLMVKGKSNLVINEKQYEPFRQTIINWHKHRANQDFSYDLVVNFAKARAETHRKYFIPLLEKIDYLIFDRCLYTSAVYQTGKLSLQQIIEINLKEGALQPDEGFVLLCQPEIALERANKRRRKKNYYRLPSMNETLKEITERKDLYMQLLAYQPDLHLLNAERSEDEVFKEIKRMLSI